MKKEEIPKLTPADTEILEALVEFRDALKTNVPIEKKFTVRTVHLDLHPRDYSPENIRDIRNSLNLSQPMFGMVIGASVKTIRSWEQGLKKPSPIANRFLAEIASNPEYWRKRIADMSVTKS